MYITYSDYAALYDAPDTATFQRLCYQACRILDRHTTGVDGVKKLKVAFPTDEDATDAVKHCAAHIVNFLQQIMEAEKSASMARGYAETGNGLRGKVISSVTAGNESISYATGQTQKTAADASITDLAFRNNQIKAIVREYLSGVTDANGVNLLYMGVYPRV